MPNNNEQFDKDVSDIVKQVSDGLDKKDLSGAISKIRQEMQENSADDWKKMLAAANKGLDDARKEFGTIDLVGVDGNNVVFENARKALVHLDSKATVVKTEAQQPTENVQQQQMQQQQQQGDGSTTRKNPDGSTIVSAKQGDGQDHPTKIIHSDGTTTHYTYDKNGKVNDVVEKDPSGKTISEYKTVDGNAWSKVSGPNELPAQIFGKLNVDNNGTHTFNDAQFGTKLTRTADGSLKIVDGAGNTLLDKKVVPIEQPANKPADAPAQKPADQPQQQSGAADRVQQNPDGSIIEYKRQGDGKAHPTKIVHPDGQTTTYTYDSNGNPNSVVEWKDGNKFSEYKASGDGTTWNKVSGDANLPPQLRGKLSVGDDGSHQFVDSVTGNTFVRRADGSIKLTDRNGMTLHEKGPDAFVAKPAGPPESYKPSDGAANPAGAPGMGEFAPGESFTSERSNTGTKGQYDIDWREKTGEEKNPADGSTTYKYKGELDDGVFSDTNFEGSERISADGKLLERHVKYDGGATVKFKTPEGTKELSDVTSVDTAFDSRSGKYVTTIKTEDGTQYRAETSPDGSVTSFKEVTDKEQSSAPGDTKANVDSFKPVDGVFNPVRPQGLGELRPGQAEGDEGKGIDWRTSRAVNNANGSTTYNYSGELEDGWIGGDTNFTAEETIDHNGQVVHSKVDYDSAKELSMLGPRGQKVQIKNAKSVETNRSGNNYETKVVDSDGKVYTFVTAPDGTVVEYKEPGK